MHKMDGEDKSPQVQKAIWIGVAVIASLGLIGLVWSMVVEIESASVAQGVMIVDSKRKRIEHFEGGIIADVRVEEGSYVRQGDLLVLIDDTQTKASYDLLKGEAFHLQATLTRLQRELSEEGTLEFSSEMIKDSLQDPEFVQILDNEQKLFVSRRLGFENKVSILRQRIGEFEMLIHSYEKQIVSKNIQFGLLEEEIESVEVLEKEDLVGKPTLLGLQREREQILIDIANLEGSIAQNRQKIGEMELQIILESDARKEQILEQVDEVQDRLYSTLDELRRAQDAYQRTRIRSPTEGLVVDLQVFSAGDVVSPGEKLMDVVPAHEDLVIEAFVNPTDIDVVVPGLPAKIRLTPFKSRQVPILMGKVTRVSADVIVDERTQSRYYLAYIQIPSSELEKIKKVTLYPGMPAEVMIISGKRTPMEYLLTPFMESLNRAFKEE